MSQNTVFDPREYRQEELAVHVLFVGEKLVRAHTYFKRTDEVVRCDHAADLNTAADMVVAQSASRPFDCVIVDMRRESDGDALGVAALSGLRAANRFVVMATPSKAGNFQDLDGVDLVLINPISRMDVVETVVSSAAERDPLSDDLIEIPRGFSSSEPLNAAPKPAKSVEETVEAAIVEAESDASTSDDGAGETSQNDVFERAAKELEELKIPAAPENQEEVVEEVEVAQPTVNATPVEKVESVQAPVAAPVEPKVEEEPEVVEAVQAVAPAVAEPVQTPADETPTHDGDSAVKKAVTKGFESSLSKIQEVDQSVWQRFVPLANFLYKKLAIVVLTALFLTFVTYGAMIVFFMGSSGWALPFELSKGHIVVEKVARDLSSMRLRRNQINQDLVLAKAEWVTAERDLSDGKLNLVLTKRTVEEEISLQTGQQLEIRQHISRLKQVINDFNALNGKGGFAKNLENAYSKRLITRKSLNSGTLAVLETLHRMATVHNEISVKQMELRRVDRRIEFLKSLLEEIDQPQIRVITSAGSDLAHLAREVIEAKNRTSAAQKLMDTANSRIERLENSLDVISANIASIEATPAARALKAPVMVLFVPYTNADQMREGEPLFRCTFQIILCSEVGKVGPVVAGETTAVHPLFGKPMRGNFVEATFDNARSVKEELMHAGRAPLWF